MLHPASMRHLFATQLLLLLLACEGSTAPDSSYTACALLQEGLGKAGVQSATLGIAGAYPLGLHKCPQPAQNIV